MEDNEFPRNPADSATGDLPHLPVPANAAAGADSAGNLFTSDDSYYVDSNCSTPYVSAPSSPGRPFDGGGGGGGGGYFYSAPASPMHFMLSTAMSSGFMQSPSEVSEEGACGPGSFEFEFSARYGPSCKDSSAATSEIGSMSSADELFLNGQIRPMKLSTHLQRPQVLAPFMDMAESDENNDYSKGAGEAEGKVLDRNSEDVFRRSRDLRLRDKSVRRRTRSLSPLRNTVPFDWCEVSVKGEEGAEEEHLGQLSKLKAPSNGDADDKGAADESETVSNETTPSASASSSRCSSAGRNSKRWVFLKDFLRSKSEGRSNHKFWTNISFSPAKEKKSSTPQPANNQKEKVGEESDPSTDSTQKPKKSGKEALKKSPAPAAKPKNGLGKRRVPLSAHELHYTANRAQAEEMRKKTFLPYRQGLLGCLGFSSKSYGAMNGFARALNPVSSR